MVLHASREGKTWYDMALVLCTVVWCASLSRLDELLDDLQAAKGGKIMRKDLNCQKRTKKTQLCSNEEVTDVGRLDLTKRSLEVL